MSNPLLSGIRVLDLTRLLPGPFCTLNLAQLGAEVIKIEEPDGGDYTRRLMPELFELVNRGKQSVTLDLRQSDDVEQFKALVAEADVVVESFRPGVMDRLGVGYETLREINPRLVYASLTGYGHSGPYRDRAGHDLNYLATAGVLDQIGRAGKAPAMSNIQIADLAGGGLTCAMGILAAVLGAQRSGEGAFVDVGMMDGSLALQQIALATLRTHGQTQPRGKDMLTGALPNYQIYQCRDGKYLAVGALEPKFAMRVFQGLGEWSGLSRLARPKKRRRDKVPDPGQSGKPASTKPRPNMLEKLQDRLDDPAQARRLTAPARWAMAVAFRLRKRDDWVSLFEDRDACVSAVLTLEEAMANEQVRARELIETVDGKPAIAQPVKFANATTQSGRAPALGEHNDAVLQPVAVTETRKRACSN